MIGSILKSLRRAHLDVLLRHEEGYRVRILERPGRWLSDHDLRDLKASLSQIADAALDAEPISYGVFGTDSADLRDVVITLVTTDTGQLVAFNALRMIPVELGDETVPVLHLGLVLVDPEHRSAGLSWVLYGLTCFLLLIRNQFRPLWVSSVTQVPAVVGMVSEFLSDVWPAPDATRCTLDQQLIARQIMVDHRAVFGVGRDATFDDARFVIRDAYTGGSDGLKKKWEEVRKHRDPRFDAFCADVLDYERGDDLLQLGRMDLAAMRRFLVRAVPRSAIFDVVASGLVVGLRRLILPVAYWFDTGRTFSTLRPVDRGQDG